MLDVQKIKKNFFIVQPFYLNVPQINKIEGTIKSVTDLMDKVKSFKKEIGEIEILRKLRTEGESHNLDHGIYFRGQSNGEDYKLLPSIGRCKVEGNKEERKYTDIQERNIFHRFRRRSYNHLNRVLTPWEALFLAKHHELPTRLLDWTGNMLVALFWACCSHKEKNGEFWAFVRQPGDGYDLNVFDAPLCTKYEYAEKFKFLVRGIKAIYPFYVDPRMIAQAGIFTIQDDPWNPIHKYSAKDYKRKDFDIFHIRRWQIDKGKDKNDIIIELNDLGINKQTLYPDIEGLTKGIPEIEDIRNK